MPNDLERLLASRDVVILDGATGTELERRGMPAPLPLWTADAAVRAPDLLRQIHVDYLEAGADVLTANTFRTHPYTLRAAGREAEAADLTRRSVEIARQACERAGRGLVAGSVAPLEDCYHPERVPPPDVLRRDHAAHVRNLVAAGVDLVLVETMNTAREAHAAAEAGLESGLPVLVSLILDQRSGDVLSGEDLEVAWAHLRALEAHGARVAGFLVNCAPPDVIAPALERTHRPQDARPIGAYANLGRAETHGNWTHDAATPVEAYAERALEWVEMGARWIGGCCGTTPDHIRAVAAALRGAHG